VRRFELACKLIWLYLNIGRWRYVFEAGVEICTKKPLTDTRPVCYISELPSRLENRAFMVQPMEDVVWKELQSSKEREFGNEYTAGRG
jgi:hypothetical protein